MTKIIDLNAYRRHKEDTQLVENMLDICCVLKGIPWEERNGLSNDEIKHYLGEYLSSIEADKEDYEILSKLFPDNIEPTKIEKSLDILMSNIGASLEEGVEPYSVLDDSDLEKAFEAIEKSFPNNPEISELIRNKITEKIKNSIKEN